MPETSSETTRKYPLFRRNLKLEELYEKYKQRYNQRLVQTQYSPKDLLWIVAVFLMLLSIPFTLNQVQKRQQITSSAANQTVVNIGLEAEKGTLTGKITQAEDLVASEGKYVQFAPIGTIIDLISCPSLPQNTGKIDFQIVLPVSGDYYFWSRIMTSDINNNSFYLQVDNQCGLIVGDINLPKNIWVWVNSENGSAQNRIKLSLSAGSHKISLIGREASVKVDRIILTNQKDCIPTLKGINCAQKNNN